MLASGSLRNVGPIKVQRARREARGIGVDRQVVLVGQPEQPDQVGRIALERILVQHIDAIVVDDEIIDRERAAALAPEAVEDPVENRQLLRLPCFQFGADDRGEITHVLGDPEIGLHEPLDARQPAASLVADAFGDALLNVEGQPLFGPAGEEMEMAAHAPEEFLASREELKLVLREQTRPHQLFGLAARGRRTWRSRTAC